MARRSGPALYELLGSGRSEAADGTARPVAAAASNVDPIQLRFFALAALALVGVVAAYLIGSARGERIGRDRLLAEQAEDVRLAEASRPAVNLGSTPATSENRAVASRSTEVAAPEGPAEASGLPAGPLPPSEPGVDPRQPGLNYFVLASTLEENAIRVVAFCRARGLDAYVVRDHNGRLREVTVLPGFRESDRSSPVVKALEERIREVGRQFKASGPGNSDFGDRYLKQFRQ